ncbi:MAG: ROK family transcriptional regulator [Hespellia sp.]|nr:ROK family transcriptional regulator [Hespellia sp.]
MEIRLQNALNIMNDIECNPGTTNTEIALKRGLSVPTISNIVNILKSTEMVMTTGTGESSGGRRPIQLCLNPKCQYSIGVSIARHTVYVVLTDFEGHVCEKEKHYIQFEENETYWNEIKTLIEQMQRKAPMPCEVGIALPGFVDYGQNIVFNTHTLGVPAISLEELHRILGESVTVDDSCKLAAMAQIFGKSDIEDHFFILLSRRVSGIMIQNGNVLKLKSSSLDIGAMLINMADSEGMYGVPGSFLDLCTASRIIDIIKEKYEITRYEDFFGEIEKGNREFAEIWESYLKNLSIAIYNIYSVFRANIVIGGEMGRFIEPYIQVLDGHVREVCPENTENIMIQCSILGEYDEAYGAALATRDSYLRHQLPEVLKNSAVTVPSQTKKSKHK